ncbi:MAG TPA: CBS domain-containing protein, partial [Dongiaceae bacterium]|nr:CBS domain-containing protein [Dongiaceae bacterium]
LNTAFYCEPTATVADIMKSDVLVVDSDLPVAQLAEQMTAAKPGLYPVVEEGVLMGSISRADVLKALLDASVRYHHKSAPPKGSQPKNPQG